MNIGFIILTRTDSRRLKNKALKFVHKKKRLTDIVFENVLKTFSKEFQIILSTTKRDIDNRLIRHTKKNYKNIKTFRGNNSNVAKRFLKTMEKFNLDYAVRVNGDSPFLDMKIIEKNLTFLNKKKYDIITNVYRRKYPKGQSVEIISYKVLKKYISKISLSKIDAENVTSFFYNENNFKKIFSKNITINQNFSSINLSVDNKKDLNFLKSVLKKKYKPNFLELVKLRNKFDEKNK